MGIEIFERAAEARGCILRVEQLVAADGTSEVLRAPGYLLTFDVGRVLIAADKGHERLLVRQIENAADVAGLQLEPLDDEEPWWRVAGNRVTRAWPGADGGDAAVAADAMHDLRLQFREDSENPRVISFKYESGAVRVGEESAYGR
ncbi:MAG: hypothetical protein JRG92_05205 [Deltaproteobacteria bacterium]|nr:hypothetical protein [Deltaproteobacteria bacterium]MBW2383010.1 hypothetical protein [Deltaproteobacteria bacterium]MBW2695465.1 hypothetical protein [Deltaproteobacteria bacterium]